MVVNSVKRLKNRPMPLNHPDYKESDVDPLVDQFKYPKIKGQKRQRNKRLNYDPSFPFLFMFLEEFCIKHKIEMDEQLNTYGEPVDIQAKVEIIEMSPTGHGGIAIHHEQPVLVPFTCVGDIVNVSVFRDCQMYYKATLMDIISPSPNRIEAPCKYFGKCGGCQIQYLSYSNQMQYKQSQVIDAFSRLNCLVKVEYPLESPKEYSYRTKLTPHYDKPRDLAMKDVPIGFNHSNSRKVLDIEECILISPKMNAKFTELRSEVHSIENKPVDGATLLLREGINGPWNLDNYDDKTYIITDPKASLTVTINHITFTFNANSFFQNNSLILPSFVNFIKSQINTKYLVDCYCGVGLFALACADVVDKVIGVEVAKIFLENAVQNAIDNNISNCEFIEGQAEVIFKSIEFESIETTVIMDPPRKGSSKAFLDQLLDFKPKTIIYVACGLYAQIRDLRYILNGIWFDYVTNFDKDFRVVRPTYKIRMIQPVDLFPQTNNVENIVILELID